MAISSFWVHLILIVLDLFGEIVVVWGIIWENPKQPEHRHEIAGKLIVGGTVLAIFCTICLFSYDEHLSQLQDDKIASQGDTIKHLGEVAAKAKSDADAASGAAQTAIVNASDAAFVASSAQSRASAASDEIDRMNQREIALRAQIGADEHTLAVAKAQVCASVLELTRTQRESHRRQIDQIRMKEALINFSGVAVYLDNQGDAEYAGELTAALNLSDLKVVPFPKYLAGVNKGRMAGVTVEYWSDVPKAVGAGTALTQRMNEDGVDVASVNLAAGPVNKIAQHQWPTDAPHEAVVVLIGPTFEQEAVAHERAGDLAAYGTKFAPTKPPCDAK